MRKNGEGEGKRWVTMWEGEKLGKMVKGKGWSACVGGRKESKNREGEGKGWQHKRKKKKEIWGKIVN